VQKSFTILEVVPQKSWYQTVPVEISGVKDSLTQLSIISLTANKNGSNTFLVTTETSICYMSRRLCRFIVYRRTREIKQEHLHAEFKNALLCSQKCMPEMEKLNAPRRAPHQHIQPNERNVEAWGNGRFGYRKGQAPKPNVGVKKYVARFALVIEVSEYSTSKTCA
jgi:hypothetical protein